MLYAKCMMTIDSVLRVMINFSTSCTEAKSTMSKSFYSFLVLCFLLTGCNNDADIYHAKYLDDIFPNSDGQQTFIVKSNFWNRPTCSEIEQWSKENIKSIEYYKVNTFLKYDENITYKNRYLESEYDAIAIDYIIDLLQKS